MLLCKCHRHKKKKFDGKEFHSCFCATQEKFKRIFYIVIYVYVKLFLSFLLVSFIDLIDPYRIAVHRWVFVGVDFCSMLNLLCWMVSHLCGSAWTLAHFYHHEPMQWANSMVAYGSTASSSDSSKMHAHKWCEFLWTKKKKEETNLSKLHIDVFIVHLNLKCKHDQLTLSVINNERNRKAMRTSKIDDTLMLIHFFHSFIRGVWRSQFIGCHHQIVTIYSGVQFYSRNRISWPSA